MSRDTSFYYSFLVLPPGKRRAMIAVWDFCRAVDDSVDEIVPAEPPVHGTPLRSPDGPAPSEARGARVAPAGGERRTASSVLADARPTAETRARAAGELARWRAELDAVYTGWPQTPQGRALQPHVRHFGLPRAPFAELIDGVEMDLDRATYATFEELLQYCRRVASSVGLMCVEIFGYTDPSTRDYAVDLGIALQITNIVRDVGADLEKGRVYLPAEDLARFDVAVDDLCGGVVTPAIRELLRFECGRAREYYRRAALELPPADARSLVAAEIMGAIYYEILERIERAGYDVFSRRIRVPRPRRAVIALRVWAEALMRSIPVAHRAMPRKK